MLLGSLLGVLGSGLVRPAAALAPGQADAFRREEVEALKEIARETTRIRETLRDVSALREIAREISRLRDTVASCQRR